MSATEAAEARDLLRASERVLDLAKSLNDQMVGAFLGSRQGEAQAHLTDLIDTLTNIHDQATTDWLANREDLFTDDVKSPVTAPDKTHSRFVNVLIREVDSVMERK